jgi:hypothetical protein
MPPGRRTASATILPGSPGGKVVERLGRQDHLPRDTVVEPASGEEERAAPVAVHERHVLQAQRIEEIGLPSAGVRLGLGDRPGGVDQADVTERLRVVADHLDPVRVGGHHGASSHETAATARLPNQPHEWREPLRTRVAARCNVRYAAEDYQMVISGSGNLNG